MSTTEEHTVVDGRVMRTSVSALQRAHRCPRAWWFRYVARLPDTKKSKGAERGTAGHLRLRRYLETGADVLDPLERLGVTRGLLPTPGDPNVWLDYPVNGADAGGVPLKGEIDLVQWIGAGHVGVVDFKFKKSIGEYGCTTDELADPEREAGIQMLGYAAALLERYPDVSHVTVTHITWQTKGARDVEPVSAHLKRHEATERWVTVTDRLVPVLHQAAAAKTKDEVPRTPDESVCEAFGGCPFKAACHDRSAQIAAAMRALQTTTRLHPTPKKG